MESTLFVLLYGDTYDDTQHKLSGSWMDLVTWFNNLATVVPDWAGMSPDQRIGAAMVMAGSLNRATGPGAPGGDTSTSTAATSTAPKTTTSPCVRQPETTRSSRTKKSKPAAAAKTPAAPPPTTGVPLSSQDPTGSQQPPGVWPRTRIAFRSIHGVGRSGVRVSHHSCVVYSIRLYIFPSSPHLSLSSPSLPISSLDPSLL